jgi:hypothetical protein
VADCQCPHAFCCWDLIETSIYARRPRLSTLVVTITSGDSERLAERVTPFPRTCQIRPINQCKLVIEGANLKMTTQLYVYTAITGEIGDRLGPINVPDDYLGRSTKYICFTDNETNRPCGWTLSPLRIKTESSRLTARWHKIMSHLCFPEAEFTLWHDGSHRLRVNPWTVVDHGLQNGSTFATFRHPLRDCAYAEISTCIRYGKDSRERLTSQAEQYKREGFPKSIGLLETGCVVRHQTSSVARLNEVWYQEVSSKSWRDQVALPYAMWKIPFHQVGILPGSATSNMLFDFRPHQSWNVRRRSPAL